jgi:hypothetical protein
MLYLSVFLALSRMPATSAPEPARRRADSARATAKGFRTAVPAGGPGPSRARRGRPAARLGNGLHDTRSEEGWTYRRKGRTRGWTSRTGDHHPRGPRLALAPACRRRGTCLPA